MLQEKTEIRNPLFDREYELHFPHRRPLSQVQADCWTSENSDRCLRYVPRMKSGWRDKMKPGWQDEIYWNFSKNLQILCKNGKSIDHTRYLSIPILLSLGCRYRIWFSDTTTSISLCNRFCTKEKISNINIMIYFKTKREKIFIYGGIMGLYEISEGSWQSKHLSPDDSSNH